MEVNRVLYGSVYQKLTWWYMGLFTRSIQAFTWECSVESMQCMVIEQKYAGHFVCSSQYKCVGHFMASFLKFVGYFMWSI